MVSSKDRAILRELASKQAAYAHSNRNIDLQKEWRRHRRFEKGRPMVHLEMWTFQQEIIPHRLQCETELGRKIETALYQQFLNFELFSDDKVVPDYFPIHWRTWFHLFDQEIKAIHASNNLGSSLGHQFQHVIADLETDIAQLRPSTYGVDRKGTLEYRELVEEIMGDILPTKMEMGCLYAVPTQKLVHMMGMETLLFSMYDYPDLFKDVMNRAADDYVAYFKWLEHESLLFPTTTGESLGQGTWCYTEELPNKTEGIKTEDVWGFLDSQETVGISPEMYHEFVFPCYQKIASHFGLLSYGCCEPVDAIWEKSISTLSNLRNLSISPWCDENLMGERLRNQRIIYHRKPSPNYIGISPSLDEAAFRSHIAKTIKAATGCQLEITQRDVYTIHQDENKAKRYIEIIREESEKS